MPRTREKLTIGLSSQAIENREMEGTERKKQATRTQPWLATINGEKTTFSFLPWTFGMLLRVFVGCDVLSRLSFSLDRLP